MFSSNEKGLMEYVQCGRLDLKLLPLSLEDLISEPKSILLPPIQTSCNLLYRMDSTDEIVLPTALRYWINSIPKPLCALVGSPHNSNNEFSP